MPFLSAVDKMAPHPPHLQPKLYKNQGQPTSSYLNPQLRPIPEYTTTECTVEMDFSLQSHTSFIGRPASDLPTPSLVLSKPVLERNIHRLQQDVQELGLSFRPHVKTLKVSHHSILYLNITN